MEAASLARKTVVALLKFQLHKRPAERERAKLVIPCHDVEAGGEDHTQHGGLPQVRLLPVVDLQEAAGKRWLKVLTLARGLCQVVTAALIEVGGICYSSTLHLSNLQEVADGTGVEMGFDGREADSER